MELKNMKQEETKKVEVLMIEFKSSFMGYKYQP